MRGLPKGWRVHHGRDAEQELRRLKRRFQAVSRRQERAMQLRRLYHRGRLPALIAGGAVILVLGLVSLQPWPWLTSLKHFASLPNCNAAHLVGLAPARRGEPGYWSRHDADGDGIACEPLPRYRQERTLAPSLVPGHRWGPSGLRFRLDEADIPTRRRRR